MAAKGKSNGKRPVVIRREEVVEGGHHGGAWKVAYADFVTAMMAFFLLMWLLNATTSEQRRGLADYFSPSNQMSRVTSGFGSIFGGHTPNDDGSMASDRGSVQMMNQDVRPTFDVEDDDSDVPAKAASYGASIAGSDTRRAQRPGGPSDTETGKGEGAPGRGDRVGSAPGPGGTGAAQGAGTVPPRAAAEQPNAEQKADQLKGVQAGADQPNAEQKAARAKAEQARSERARFEQAAQQIKAMMEADPGLAGLARQLAVDVTPAGLRIQILDEDGQPMFATGSAAPNDRARALLLKVAPVLMKLPEQVSITGHTDAAPFKGADHTNWELSADRANATRRLLMEAGLPESRVQTVSGEADRDPLLPGDPLAAANRRIAIMVLRSAGKKGG